MHLLYPFHFRGSHSAALYVQNNADTKKINEHKLSFHNDGSFAECKVCGKKILPLNLKIKDEATDTHKNRCKNCGIIVLHKGNVSRHYF